ncbi:hypothetical protein CCACVL1_30899 [Corchorus capsularis]|uniref:Uncharacterized protein n=1 Tax=Corchorus capsularis TaxID=210143 RepID=A0A1R3FUS6_COCAP|nr:hypothetical protein CCACVL1_30899 [Corchorus capsularis]
MPSTHIELEHLHRLRTPAKQPARRKLLSSSNYKKKRAPFGVGLVSPMGAQNPEKECPMKKIRK